LLWGVAVTFALGIQSPRLCLVIYRFDGLKVLHFISLK